jgi:hypothetical protein
MSTEIPGSDHPVRIVTAGYSGGAPCTRCGVPVTNGQRVTGTKGPEIARYLILCRPCYRVFAKALPPGFASKPA